MGNIIILSIGKEYDIEKLSEVIDLSNSEDIKSATNIIVDIGELASINVMGLEILMLKEKPVNQGPYSVVFCGLKTDTRTLFETLGSEGAFGELANFSSANEALNFLNDNQGH